MGLQVSEVFVCKMVSLETKFYAKEFVMHGWVKTKSKNKILTSCCCPLFPKKTNATKKGSHRTDFSVGFLSRQD